MRNCYTEQPKKSKIRMVRPINFRRERFIDQEFEKILENEPKDIEVKERLPIKIQSQQKMVYCQPTSIQPHKNEVFHHQKYKALPISPNLHAYTILIILVLGLLIITYCLISPQTCIRDYQKLDCWKEENNSSQICLSLQQCMAEEGKSDYIEYLVTLSAACIFLFRKYQGEVIRVLWDLKKTKIF